MPAFRNIFGAALFLFMAAAAANEVDKRQVIPLSEHQRDHVLTEMRALLSGTRNILDALSRDEMAVVAREADSLGLGMAGKGEDHLGSILPGEFMRLGMSVHQDFDNIARDARTIKVCRLLLASMANRSLIPGPKVSHAPRKVSAFPSWPSAKGQAQ